MFVGPGLRLLGALALVATLLTPNPTGAQSPPPITTTPGSTLARRLCTRMSPLDGGLVSAIQLLVPRCAALRCCSPVRWIDGKRV